MTTDNGAARSFDLDGGAKLLLVEDHTLPLVSMTLAYKSGSAHDPAGKEGASRLAMRMLRRGAGDLGAKEIEDAIDRLGAEVGTDVTASGATVGAQVIRRSLDPFVELLTKMVGSPTFPKAELERLRRETVAEIIESRDNDRALAHRALRRSLFAGHLYGRATSGTTASVETLGRSRRRGAISSSSTSPSGRRRRSSWARWARRRSTRTTSRSASRTPSSVARSRRA
jgi:zinc protease